MPDKSYLSDARMKFDHDRMTRRQALRKLGIGSGMTVALLLGADDVLRMVGKKLQQRHDENEVVNTVAKELRATGVAFAQASPWSSYGGPCGAFAAGLSAACADCNTERQNYCTNKGTIKCNATTCAVTGANGSNNVCNNGGSYQDLQNVWQNMCADCLATCR